MHTIWASDEHINGILSQALKHDSDRKIILVSKNADEVKNRSSEEIAKQILSCK